MLDYRYYPLRLQNLIAISSLPVTSNASLQVTRYAFVKLNLSNDAGHLSWNHRTERSSNAPHPQDPDASEKMVVPVGIEVKSATPFHSWTKTGHHVRSLRHLAFRQTLWDGRRGILEVSISWKRKTLPGRTTAAA